jgi:predicted nucleic acid-binding protein
VGTALISRAEISAALGKAVRVGALAHEEAMAALQVVRAEWGSLVRIQITEAVVARADDLAWGRGLRGYDAVHLAAATSWQDALGEPVTVATFDRQLWQAALTDGLIPWPDHLG